MFHRKVDFDIGEHTCTFRRINSFELHQSGGVGTETVLFDEKRYKNAVEQAYQVIAVHTVENVVRKSKLQLAVNARAYLSRFNFSGGDQEKLCGVLSGGERNRLHLAMALKEEGNVLLLDEPTNDIDVNTLRALEEGLEDFAGCAVVISHDRWFLDRICTHILAFEGDSNVFYFEGSYSEYEENKMKRLGNEEPKRVRYRKLMTD